MGTLNSLTQFYFYGAIQEGTETHAVLYSVLATVAIAASLAAAAMGTATDVAMTARAAAAMNVFRVIP